MPLFDLDRLAPVSFPGPGYDPTISPASDFAQREAESLRAHFRAVAMEKYRKTPARELAHRLAEVKRALAELITPAPLPPLVDRKRDEDQARARRIRLSAEADALHDLLQQRRQTFTDKIAKEMAE